MSSPFYTVVICLFEPSKGGYGYRRSGRDKYGPPTRTEYRLIVENLSSRCSWQDLKVWASSTSQIRLGMGKSRKQAIYAGLGIQRCNGYRLKTTRALGSSPDKGPIGVQRASKHYSYFTYEEANCSKESFVLHEIFHYRQCSRELMGWSCIEKN